MWKRSLLILSLGVSLKSDQGVHSFLVSAPVSLVVESNSNLLAVRQPRRNLKKRKGRERTSPSSDFSSTRQQPNPNEIWETKPLIAAQRKEAGEDFWIDPKDSRKEKERQQAIANRKAAEGAMPQEKLRSEVVAPYKQNWIGVISLVFIVLATIVKNFPQVLDNPSIGFPDLDAGDPIPLQSTLTTASELAARSWTDYIN